MAQGKGKKVEEGGGRTKEDERAKGSKESGHDV